MALASARSHPTDANCDQLRHQAELALRRQATLPLSHAHHSVHAARNSTGVLVCVFGEVRGDATVHLSLHRHLVRPLRADLAVLCGEAECSRYAALLPLAKFVWRWEPPPPGVGWNALISKRGPLGAAAMRIAERAPMAEGNMAWGQTTARGGALRNSSGAATMEVRAQLLEKLVGAGLLDDSSRYQWFIFTRPDNLFMCHHPRIEDFSGADITVGEERMPPLGRAAKEEPISSNTVGDRHAVVRRSAVAPYLGVLWCALRWTVASGRLYCVAPPKQQWRCNVESTLAACLRQARVGVRRFSFSHVLVATDADHTRWSHGTWLYLQHLSQAQLNLERSDVRDALAVNSAAKLMQQPAHRWRLATQALMAALPGPRGLLERCLRIKSDYEALRAARTCASAK